MTGIVKRLVRDRGFGFIQAEDGIEYFFHRSSCARNSPFDTLNEEDHVEFEEGGGAKGPRATDVTRV